MRSHPSSSSSPSSGGTPPEPRIQVFALGGLRVEADGDPVADLLSQPVRCGVFLYLAVERAATRDELTALFWPERTAERARHSLSQTLYELRRRFGPGWLHASGERLEVSPLVAVDAVEFAACGEAGRDEEALARFAGPFLDGVHLAASAPFESWVQRRRAHLLRQFQGVCRRLTAAHAGGGEVDRALAVARRWAEVDPLDDEAHHRLIELLAAAGRRSEALRAYDEYERRIAAELDVQPLEETRQLAADLRGAAAPAVPPAPDSVSAAPSVSPLAIPEPARAGRKEEPRPAVWGPRWIASLRPRARRRALLAALVVLAALPLLAHLRGGRGGDAPAAAAGEAERGEAGIAVLPFRNLSPDSAQAWFAEGIAEDLLTSLSRVEGLRVISRASSWRYRGREEAADQIARELGVRYLLTGSVRRERNRVRIAAQLVDARSGTQVWAETYEREMAGIFALQSEIAQRIAAALAQRLTPRDRARLAASGTRSVAAYDLLLRGREYLNRPGEADVRKFAPALSLFRQALEADPGFARAYVGMSDAFRTHVGLPLVLRRDSALHYARRAVRAGPGLAEAETALGWAFLVARQPDSAGAALDRALALDAHHAEALAGRARLAATRGRFDEAVRWQRRAVAADPASARQVGTLGDFLMDLGDQPGAAAAFERAAALAPDAPVPSYMLAQIHLIRGDTVRADAVMRALARAAAGHPGAEFLLARYDAQRGRYETAAAQLSRVAPVLRGAAATVALQQAYAADRLGQRARVEALLARAEADLAAREREGFTTPRLRVQLAALRGDADAAVAALRRRWHEEPGGDLLAGPQIGFYWIDHDPLLAGLRSEPAFQALLARIRAELDAMRARTRE